MYQLPKWGMDFSVITVIGICRQIRQSARADGDGVNQKAPDVRGLFFSIVKRYVVTLKIFA